MAGLRRADGIRLRGKTRWPPPPCTGSSSKVRYPIFGWALTISSTAKQLIRGCDPRNGRYAWTNRPEAGLFVVVLLLSVFSNAAQHRDQIGKVVIEIGKR